MNVKPLPGFVYVKDLRLGVILNKNAEVIAYAEDPADMHWFFDWIVDYDKHRLKTGLGRNHRKILKRRHIRSVQSGETKTVPKPFPAAATHSISVGDRKSARKREKAARKKQLIGEQIGPKRVHQLRLFQTPDEAERWVGEGFGRRSRLVNIGSVAWNRALEEEKKLVRLDAAVS